MECSSSTLHLELATLQCRTWFVWVPSEANISDIPSRVLDSAPDICVDLLNTLLIGDAVSTNCPPAQLPSLRFSLRWASEASIIHPRSGSSSAFGRGGSRPAPSPPSTGAVIEAVLLL